MYIRFLPLWNGNSLFFSVRNVKVVIPKCYESPSVLLILWQDTLFLCAATQEKIREWVKVNTLTLAQRSVLAGKWSRGPDLGRFSHPPNASSAQLTFTPTSIHLTECISSRLLPRFLCLFAQCVFSWLHCSQWVRKAGKSGKNRGKRQCKIGTW